MFSILPLMLRTAQLLRLRRTLPIAVFFLGMGCGGDDFTPAPADVAGSYTVAITNGPNNCGFQGWTENQMQENIGVAIEQEGSDVVARVEGIPGIYLGLVVGSNEFHGSVNGTEMALSISGTMPLTLDSCSYTLNAFLDAVVEKDIMSGTIRYRPNQNTKPECSSIMGCTNEQSLAGARPPKR